MKKSILLVIALMVLVGTYYAFWRYRLADDVARIEASLAHQNQQFRAHNRWVTLKADSVGPAGFPWKSAVRAVRPTLTFVWGDETYGVSIPWADFALRDPISGTYAVTYAPTIEAVYAKSGQAPEEYALTPHETIALLLRAQGDSRECPILPGANRCAAVTSVDPLISYAAQLPASLTVTIALNGKSKDTNFKLMPLNVPVYQKIPENMDRPLQLLVGILREAMIYQN